MNQHLVDKMTALQALLMAQHQAGAGSSSSSRGSDRELFIQQFLRGCLPQTHRLESGEITNAQGVTSGQIDIIVEHPFAPSFAAATGSSRFVLQESAAVALEVKSNLMNQWGEVEAVSSKLKKLNRPPAAAASLGGANMSLAFGAIPLFAIGYEGWKTLQPMIDKVTAGTVDGLLVIETGLLVVGPRFANGPSATATGPTSLWLLIALINDCMRAVSAVGIDTFAYVR